ncbi:MAG: probable dioxygenase [uncultured Thiotrichaceae bacterium]|uniref:Probable dioxygenase n=1 Tax=uncultured Thiotrichaceae bacterium TaxID=298394 RepID=A0A6S6SC66_9GAMM|nr:MAG: probable dioxygenase [uncultured Thiotrichaceae bacterium]
MLESPNIMPFHLAIQVRNMTEAKHFYGGVLGFAEGRSDKHWVDYNCFGHQLVCHLNPELGDNGHINHYCNDVDAHAVPVPHFGVVLEMNEWKIFAEKLTHNKVAFIIEPYIRFAGQTGEQATLFFKDPSGNALEFKSFQNIDEQLFAQ